MTNDVIVSGNVDTFRFRSQGRSTSGSETLSGGPVISMATSQETTGELDDGAESTINQAPSSEG
jgi:hypothetical protein